jgi:hypothetical protein
MSTRDLRSPGGHRTGADGPDDELGEGCNGRGDAEAGGCDESEARGDEETGSRGDNPPGRS